MSAPSVGGIDHEKLSALFSSHYGILNPVTFPKVRQSDHHCHIAVVKSRITSGPRAALGGSGFAADRETAAWAAIGEAIERNFALDLGQKPIRRAVSHSQLTATGESALDPELFNVYSDTQYAMAHFAKRPLDRSTPLDWVEGLSLTDGEPVWIPAFVAFFRYGIGREIGSSSGLACGDSFASATSSALLELVERDAFCYSWWTRTPFQRIDVQAALGKCLEEAQYLFGPWLDHVEVGFSTMDHGINVTIARMHSRKIVASKSGSLVAAAAHLESTTSIMKALFELFGGCEYLFRADAGETRFDNNWDETVSDFDDARNFHLQAEYDGSTDPLFSDTSPMTAERKIFPVPGYATIATALTSAGLNSYAVDLTPKNIATCGLRVVRAVVPGLIGLNGQHRYRPWGHPRLFANLVAPTAGVRVRGLDALQPLPHPFP